MRTNSKFLLLSAGVLSVFSFLSLSLNRQIVSAQTKLLTYPEITTALNAKLPPQFKTKADFITWLIDQIKQRKIDKPLNESREEDLRQAGATDELIEVIRQNSPTLPTPTPIPILTPTPTLTPGPTLGPNPKPDAAVFIKQGNELRDRGEYELSIKEYDKAIVLDPKNPEIFVNRGMAHHYWGDSDSAFKDYRAASWFTTEHKDKMNCFLYDDQYDNDYKNAIDSCNKAIASEANLSLAYYKRGIANSFSYKYLEAINDYNKAIELNPYFYGALANRGVIHKNSGGYDLAIADFNKAIEINPKLINAYSNRGECFNKQGNYDQAIKDFTKVIEIDPNVFLAYSNRGYAYEMKKDYSNAAADYQKAFSQISSKFHKSSSTYQDAKKSLERVSKKLK